MKQAFLFVLLLSQGTHLKADIACDGWEPYKDEKCFQVMNTGQQIYDSAKSICAEHNSTLVTIKSPEEQDFITKLLFESHKIVDEVWIGAHKDGKVFKWDLDGSEVTYTNWADKAPSNLANEDCVQLLPKPTNQGKWDDESCSKKNVVLCQKFQVWTSSVIQQILLNERKQLQEILDRLKNQDAIIADQKATIAALKTSTANIVPIGFTYLQLPKDKAPADIWPSFKWQDVSPDYAGVFFRVMGGASGKFGDVQEEDAPRIANIQLSNGDKYADKNVNIPKGGMAKIKAGSTGNMMFFEFDVSNTEVRPRNMAVKVWRRTA